MTFLDLFIVLSLGIVINAEVSNEDKNITSSKILKAVDIVSSLQNKQDELQNRQDELNKGE